MPKSLMRKVEGTVKKIIKIKKLKKKVLKLKKRCRKYKKLVRGLQEQLALPTERVEVLVGFDILNMLELSIVNAGDVYNGVLSLHLKKKEIHSLRLSIANPIMIKMPTTDNPLSLCLQAETLAEYLGIKLKIGNLLSAGDILGVGEKTVADPTNPDKKVIVPVIIDKKVPEKEKKVEPTKDNVQPSSPAIPSKEKAPQQNTK